MVILGINTVRRLPDKSVRWDDTLPNLYKGLRNRSHEQVAQTLRGIPRNFWAVIKMNFHETTQHWPNNVGGEIVETLCVVLTSCCFEGRIQSMGVMTLHHSSFHEKIALLCSSQEYSVCIRSRSNNDAPTTQTKCKCNSENAYVVSFFCSVNISPCPERIYF